MDNESVLSAFRHSYGRDQYLISNETHPPIEAKCLDPLHERALKNASVLLDITRDTRICVAITAGKICARGTFRRIHYAVVLIKPDEVISAPLESTLRLNRLYTSSPSLIPSDTDRLIDMINTAVTTAR